VPKETVCDEYTEVATVGPGDSWQATSPYAVLPEPATWGS
jgi:hypothetical protein